MARPTTTRDIATNKRGSLWQLPEELQISLIIVSIEDAPETRASNVAYLEH